MLLAAFAFPLAVTLYGPTAAPPAGRPVRSHHRDRERRTAERRLSPGALYSARAKRRIATYLRLRILEERLQGLRRAADVVEHRLPLDALFANP